MRKPRLITRGVEFLMDERDHTTILISLAKDAVPVDEHRLDLLRSKLRDLDNQIASDGRADAPRDSRGPKAPRVSFGRKADSSLHPRWTRKSTRLMAATMDRYKLALLLLTIAIVPLFYVSVWMGLAGLIATYALIARFANRAFDRQSKKHTDASHGQPKR